MPGIITSSTNSWYACSGEALRAAIEESASALEFAMSTEANPAPCKMVATMSASSRSSSTSRMLLPRKCVSTMPNAPVIVEPLSLSCLPV